MQNETQLATASQGTKRPNAEFGQRGIVISNFDELQRFSEAVSKSGLCPKGMESQASIFVAIQMGLEVGLSPMAALQNIAVVNGRPTIWGDAQLAVCRGTGEMESFSEWFEVGGVATNRNPSEYKDDTAAVCKVKRRGGSEVESAFSVADAKRAGLWGKAGPWTQYPFRMLRNRARSFALRDTFGDALKGFRTTEDVKDDEIERDVTPQAADSKLFKEPSQPLPLPPVAEAEKPVLERARERGVGKRSPSQPTPAPVAEVEATTPESGMLLEVPVKSLREQVQERIATDGLKWSDVLAKLQGSGIGGDAFMPLETADDEVLSAALEHWTVIVKILGGKGGK